MNYLIGMMNLLGAVDFSSYKDIPDWLAPILQTVYNILNAIVIPIIVIVACICQSPKAIPRVNRNVLIDVTVIPSGIFICEVDRVYRVGGKGLYYRRYCQEAKQRKL